MFCKWCGNKINNNGVPCPTCGKEQDALENGNGFWDLCEVEPKRGKQGAVPLVAVESSSSNVSDEKHTQAKRGDHQRTKKAVKRRRNGIAILVFVLCILVTVGVIEASIALGKASKCMDEMASVITQLSSLRTNVSNAVSEIEEHIDAAITTTDAQSSEGTEDNAVDDKLDEILDLENAAGIVDGVISIESHKIESTKADMLLIVSGYPVESESARVVWQQFNKQTEEWDIIAENQGYILLKESNEMNQIRALCITQNEYEEYVVYGAIYTNIDEIEEPDDFSSEEYFSPKI